MSQPPRKRKYQNPPPPTDIGQPAILSAAIGIPEATIRKQYSRHKYDNYIIDGKYDIDGIKENFAKIFNKKNQAICNVQYGKDPSEKSIKKSGAKKKPVKKKNKETTETPETKKEVERYLDEKIGELSTLAIDELWRRNELEKLLMAQIKRRVAEKELINAADVKRESFSAGLQIREGLESIAERCAPLVAASDDQFECREILFKEINHILNGMADALEVVG